MTAKEIIEMYKGKYDLVEIYVGDGLRTESYDLYDPEQVKDYKAESWALMKCEDEKILCILISSILSKSRVWRGCDNELPTVDKVEVLLGSGRIVVAKYLADERLWVDSTDTVVSPVAYRV